MIRHAAALPALSLLLLAACGEEKAPTPAPVAAAEAEAPAGDKTPAASAGAKAEAPGKAEATAKADTPKTPATPGAGDEGREACKAFAERMCKEVGPDKQTCGAIELASGILPVAACDAAMANVDEALARLSGTKEACAELVAKLCGDLGPETSSCAMVKSKTPQFPPSRCQQMMTQYDSVLAELKQMEARNKPLSAELVAKLAAPGAASYGPDDAKVVVVEYSDFECPYCGRAATALNTLKEKYGDKVRFVFRQFPLSFHKNAMPAAEASLEALSQGKFWELHDLLFQNQRALTRPELEGYAAKVGMDVGKLKAALDAGTHRATVEADMALGKEVGVQGTPSLFVGGERVQNPGDVAGVSLAIDKALAGGGGATVGQ